MEAATGGERLDGVWLFLTKLGREQCPVPGCQGDAERLAGVGSRAQDMLFLPRECWTGFKPLCFWHFEPLLSLSWPGRALATARALVWADKAGAKSLPVGCALPAGPGTGTQVPSQGCCPEGRLRALFIPPGGSGAAGSSCVRRSETEQPFEGLFASTSKDKTSKDPAAAQSGPGAVPDP